MIRQRFPKAVFPESCVSRKLCFPKAVFPVGALQEELAAI